MNYIYVLLQRSVLHDEVSLLIVYNQSRACLLRGYDSFGERRHGVDLVEVLLLRLGLEREVFVFVVQDVDVVEVEVLGLDEFLP